MLRRRGDDRRLFDGRGALTCTSYTKSTQSLSLGELAPRAYAALATATQLTALTKLSLSGCRAEPAPGPDVPAALAGDGGLQLLAEAPWIGRLRVLLISGGGARGAM